MAASDTKKKVSAGKADSGQEGRKSAAQSGESFRPEQQPRPVRSASQKAGGPARKGAAPRTGANKKTGGANKKTTGVSSDSDKSSDEDEDEDESTSKEQEEEKRFWQGLVSAAYRSRRARGDWPKD